ncbi:MAG: 2-hydroxyacyl-CoA dehydratase family protein [Pseudomonadota bacterium]
MEELLKKFTPIVKDPHSWLTRWKKETGKKILGCFPMYIPEEIIHAAGILPIQLLGSNERITLGDKYCHPYVCDLVRGNFDLSVKGKMDYLDGVIFSDYCLTEQLISDIWIRHSPDSFYKQLILPKNLAMSYADGRLLSQFNDLKKGVEELSGRKTTDSDLKKSIAIYNKNKKLLQELYNIRTDNPGLFMARDLATVIAAAMLMPKEDHNELLLQFIEEAKKQPKVKSKKIRLVVSGSLCDMPELEILDIIEELGAQIVDDDLYVGRRYFYTLVDETINPMDAIVKHYKEDVPCPTKLYPGNDWVDYISKFVKETKADGIVVLVLKYCEAQLFDIPTLTRRLTKEGMPILILEMHHSGASGQVRNRLQAFLEIME